MLLSRRIVLLMYSRVLLLRYSWVLLVLVLLLLIWHLLLWVSSVLWVLCRLPLGVPGRYEMLSRWEVGGIDRQT